MKHYPRLAVLLCAAICLPSSFALLSAAQTLSLHDRSIIVRNPDRIGINIGTVNYYDSGQVLKNLIGSNNPGMEPLLNQQIWVLDKKGTPTTFSVPDQWDAVPANYWAGGTVTVVESESGGAQRRCSGTIASNTGPNYPNQTSNTYPLITISSPCAESFDVGDIVIITKSTYPTPESWWESGSRGGTWGAVGGGGRLVSDTNDLCATCGRQALNMDARPNGSSASATWYFDSGSDNAYVLLNGTYRVTFWAKLNAGSPTLTVTANRLSAGGFNCGKYLPRLTTSWALYKWDCTASENAATIEPGNAQVKFSVKGGSIYLDNVSFAKTNTDPANPTIFRDEVIQTLQKFYGPPSIARSPTLRYWLNQNAETMNNWTQRDYAHAPVASGVGYFIQPAGGGAVSLSLHDYLVICEVLKADPYLEVPVTFSNADAASLIEFLGAAASSPYGARRGALGQNEPWTRVFNTIHLSFCNECWNFGSFAGQSLAFRRGAPDQEYYYDYSTRARDIFAAMRAAPGYNPSSFDLGMNAQTAVTWTMDAAIARAHPDSIEIAAYTYGPVKSFSDDAALWQPAVVDPYAKVMSPANPFYQSVHDYQALKSCGPAGTARCKIKIYEWGQGTLGGGIDQKHLDYINAGAGEGLVMALQPLLNMQDYGIGPQAFFSLAEYRQNGNPAPKLWGNVVDMGGATNHLRSTFLGPQLVNQSIIGPMFSCTIKNNLTYRFAGSPNGEPPMPAVENVPYLFAFCFKNGDKRSIVVINTDLTTSHAISFEGTDPPQKNTTERQLAPGSLNDLNESPSGSPTVRAPSTTSIKTSLLQSLDKIDLPPASVTAFDYTIPATSVRKVPRYSGLGQNALE